MAKRATLAERDANVLWHPFTHIPTAPLAIPIVRAQGALLYAEDGREYIDAISSWWTNLHGHAHPYIAERIAAQARTLEHVIFAGFTHEPAVTLAERLLQILPSNQARVFLFDNGSTAVEVAIKMALQYWWNQGLTKRRRIIAFEHSYHGDTFGAMSASARSVFSAPFIDLLFEVRHIPLPNNEDDPASLEALQRELATGEVAAFIFEPLLLGAGGMLMYRPEPLNALIAACRKAQVLTIADEALTGFGRTGKLFACHYLSQQPDIICMSKGISGGFMALGATSCSDHVFEAFQSADRTRTFFHGHSYTGSPLACAAANASLDLLLSDECQSQIEWLTQQSQQFVNSLRGSTNITNARCCGTVAAFELEAPGPSSYLSPVRDALMAQALRDGVLLRPLGNTVYLMPPYCISAEQLGNVHATARALA